MGTAFLVVLVFLERWERSGWEVMVDRLPIYGCIYWDASQAATMQLQVDFAGEVYSFRIFPVRSKAL